MLDNLPALTGGLLPSKLDREVAKARDRIDASSLVACHRDAARIDRRATTGARGMVRIGQLASLQAGLTRANPHAAEWVHAAGHATVAGIVGVIYDAGMEG